MAIATPRMGLLLPLHETVLWVDGDVTILIDMARAAEQAGYDSVWAGDSLLARPRAEPLTLLSAIAAATAQVHLATAVLLPLLRHPLSLAHAVATLDRICQGRLTLGVGLPAEMISGMRSSPMWAWFTGLAHTLPYNVILCGPGMRLPAGRLAAITVPVLAIGGGRARPGRWPPPAPWPTPSRAVATSLSTARITACSSSPKRSGPCSPATSAPASRPPTPVPGFPGPAGGSNLAPDPSGSGSGTAPQQTS